MASDINNINRTSNLSLARQNSVAYKEYARPKETEASDDKTAVTASKTSNLAKLVAKIDDLGSSGQATGDSSKVQILSIFHPDFDASALRGSQRKALRAALYFEEARNINFGDLQTKDIDKLEAMNKALDSLKDDSEKDVSSLFKELGIDGLVV